MAPFTRLSAAFTRRKSTGNVLDEVPVEEPSPQGSSFTVLPRAPRKNVISFDAPSPFDNRFSHASSAVTRATADTASSSVRYSSTSTIPSSFEIDDPRSSQAPTATRNGSKQNSPELFAKLSDQGSGTSRDRALTTSSYASTAVPPQLESPLPTLGDDLFGDFDNVFAGIGGRIAQPSAQQSLPQPPQRTFQRAESEPIVRTRKPVGSGGVGEKGTTSPDLAQTASSPDPNRKSTDLLVQTPDSYPSSPDQAPAVPPHLATPTPIALHSNLSSRQTLSSSSSAEGKKSRKVSFDSSAVEKPRTQSQERHRFRPSSRDSDSSRSFNVSALTYSGDSTPQNVRKMTQKDFEAMKEREAYNEKLRLDRGESIDAEGPTIYEDLEDEEEEMRKIAKKREVQQAKLAVNRQKMKKIVGQEIIDSPTNNRKSNSPSATTAGASPDPNTREDHHLLPYAHNMSAPVTPQDPMRRLTLSGSSSSPNLLLPRSSGALDPKDSGDDEDDDVPLAYIQHALTQKEPEVNRRISAAGSLADGRASITPSFLGGSASSNRLSVSPGPGQFSESRPKSRLSTASNLPAFAQRLPAPEQLPLISSFQGSPSPNFTAGSSGYFQQQQTGSAASIHGGMSPQPSPIVYQSGFTGPYHAASSPGTTLMDKVQEEERRKKSKYQIPQPQMQRTMTMPNMPGFNPYMGMPMFPMQQQMSPMQIQQQMMLNAQMSFGNPYMGMQNMAAMHGMPGNMVGMDQVGTQNMIPSVNGNAQQRRISQQSAPRSRQPSGYLGSLPAIPDMSPTRSTAELATGAGLLPGYAPSLAPSERSNVGMPSRYKPVTVSIDTASTNDMPRPQSARPASRSPVSEAGIKATIRPLSRASRGFGSDGAADDNDADNEGSGWGAMKLRRLRHRSVLA